MLRNKKSSAELEGWSWVAILNRMVTEKVTFEQSVKGASQTGNRRIIIRDSEIEVILQ